MSSCRPTERRERAFHGDVPLDPETEPLTAEWLTAPTSGQEAPFDAIQRRALEMVPTLPPGHFFVKTVHRGTAQGIRDGSACHVWGVGTA